MTAKVDKLIEEERRRIEKILNNDMYRMNARQHRVCPDCEIKMEESKFIFRFWSCPKCGLTAERMAGGP